MNKNKILIITIILILTLTTLGIILYQTNKDSYKFKKEYEKYNNTEKYINIEIPKDNRIIYLNNNNILKEIKTGNKIIYLGYPTDNKTRLAVPILLNTAKETDIKKVYYYNFKNLKENNKIYQKLLQTINKSTKQTQNKLTTPTVILINQGKITSTQIGIPSTTNNNKLTKKQQEELTSIYEDMIIELLLCSDNCKD